MRDVADLTCGRMFGAVRGAEMADLFERTTGELCPCLRDKHCPLVPSAHDFLEVITTRAV